MVYPSSSEEEEPILEVQNHLGSPMGAVPHNSPTSTSSTCVENGFNITPNSISSPLSPNIGRAARMLRRQNEHCLSLLLQSSCDDEPTHPVSDQPGDESCSTLSEEELPTTSTTSTMIQDV